MAALRVSDVPRVAPTPPAPDPSAAVDDDGIVELRGTLAAQLTAMRTGVLDRPAAELDSVVELIRLRTELVDRDRRITALSTGLRTWRERAFAEAAARRTERADAHDREREIVSLLHQQMQLADSATAELERIRARRWWQRLRG
ncbi:MAG: hypothetical protein M3R48_07890 [Candidatus Dormibacteraeota bacterium]|nr:hypothetical protein [Candidatus Dormibacteraeota bacterium]